MPSNVTAGKTHDISLAVGSDTYGFMLQQGTALEERVNDFAPTIGSGDNPAFAEGAWRAWEQDNALEGIDQLRVESKNKIYWSDGNIETTRDGLIQLASAWASSDASKTATAPMIGDFSTNRVVCVAGTKVRRFDTSLLTWADSTTTLGASGTFYYPHNTVALVACGSGADFYRSTDLDTWTQPAAGQKASVFVTWREKVWLGYQNTIKSSSDNGTTWSAAINVGDPNTNITNIIVAFNVMFIRKEEALYYYDGTNVVEVYRKINSLYSGNKTLIYHSDGFMYMGEGTAVKKFSISSGSITNMVDVTPLMWGDANKELYGHGTPVWMFSGPQHLYVGFTGGENSYPEVLAYNGQGWHQVYRGTASATLNAAGYSRLMGWLFLNDGSTRRKKMVTLRDWSDADYPSSGEFHTSLFDAILPQMPKGFGAVRVWGRNLSSTRTIAVHYRTTLTGSWTLLGTVDADVYPDPVTLLFSTSNKAIGSNAAQLRFVLSTDSAASTPVLLRFSVKYLNRPLTVHAYSMVLTLK